jgi:tRNA/tmRNA/rRNA uracil-C5-methylase (TrmA/RlmC/RlmD family)
MKDSSPVGRVPVRIERPATGGGVGHLPDGRAVFVRHCLPGELVEVRVIDSAKSFARADAVQVLAPSPDRVGAPCPYAHPGGCGGCDLQHASVRAQRSWKEAIVREQLRRIAALDRDVELIVPPVDAKGSRVRLRCAVDGDGHLGLRVSRSHDVVPVEACWITDERVAPAFARSWRAADEVELRAIGDGTPFAVVKRSGAHSVRHELRGLTGRALSPDTRSRVAVRDWHFVVSPHSFWQSHRAAPELLVDEVLAACDLRTGDRAVDLYSGVGLFSVPMAVAVGSPGSVRAVESSPHAVRDLRQNADGLGQLRAREWSVTPRAVNDTVGAEDVVVADPPRGGLAKGVADALVRRSPRRIVYVSCDAATFARDLKILAAGGFAVSDLKAFDFFPMTEHVELVTTLDFDGTRRESGFEGVPRPQ